MANKDMVKGAEPFGRIYEARVYEADGTVYQGDFLKLHADGTVEQAAAGNACVGVAAHYATAGQDVLVYDHPDQLFQIQSDDATAPADVSGVGLNYDIIVASANTTYRRSGMELDGSTGATNTATFPLRLMQLNRRVDNAYGANALCVVRINNHQNGPATGIAGV